VCKVMDYGKYKYQAQKKANEARKKQKVIEVKEIKLRPGIDTHDYDVKMRAMKRFFEDGDKVKVTMRFRGREMAHTELGFRPAAEGEVRHRGNRQGGVRAEDGRPPDDHDPGAALRQSAVFCASDRSGPGPFGSGFFVCLINKSGKLQDQRLTRQNFRTYH
jgi:hypothetical protein